MIPRNLSSSEAAGALPVWAQHLDPQSALAPPEPSRKDLVEYGCVDWYIYRPDGGADLPPETADVPPRELQRSRRPRRAPQAP